PGPIRSFSSGAGIPVDSNGGSDENEEMAGGNFEVVFGDRCGALAGCRPRRGRLELQRAAELRGAQSRSRSGDCNRNERLEQPDVGYDRKPHLVVQAARFGCSRLIERDRKSTRLNSSHGSISYAVFCLKKKTMTR